MDINQSNIGQLEAFEMWLYRRMLRISWKEHKTNGEILHKMKTKRSLLNTIKNISSA